MTNQYNEGLCSHLVPLKKQTQGVHHCMFEASDYYGKPCPASENVSKDDTLVFYVSEYKGMPEECEKLIKENKLERAIDNKKEKVEK